jgi:predicted HTH transcriptional regulator|nr:ATP-binding protein [Blautia sp. AM29-29]
MRKERKIINTNIRLNLCDEQDRQAWEYLQTMDREKYKSYTRAVVVALNDYFSREYRNEADPYLETREKEDAFQERVETAIRDGVKESVPMAMAKNLRNIHLGATIVGIYRQDVYEIPPDAIRELIINAMVHRSYLDHGTIQVAVYDNRLEITSPGKLPMGQTMERMKEGYSKIRNEALAHAFAYMNLIEHWGSGIPRIIDKVKAAGLRELEFIGGEVDLRINIYRGQVDTNNAIINANGTKNGANGVKCGSDNGTNGAEVPLNKEQTQIEKLLQIIEKNPSATQAYYAEKMGISKRTVSRMFASLQEKGRLVQSGTKRKANWKIIR